MESTMVEHHPLMVPGSESSGEKLAVTAPYDNALIATCELANEATIEQALQTASERFADKRAQIPLRERLKILERAAAIMVEQEESLAFCAAQEGGKPLLDSRVEVARAIDGIKICIETMRTESGTVIPMGVNDASAKKVAFTRREPIGVVVAVSAFNHPLNLIVHQVAPAVAAGCPVIVKPAKKTPLSCIRFVQILHQAGLPEQWCQVVVIGSAALSTKLVTDQRLGFFSFIGSARVGWMLRAQLAPGTRCALEHGGVAPVIVAEDADMATMVPKLVKAGFYHAGQVCVSVQRIYAHERIAEELAEKIAAAAKTQKIGDPLSAETEIGPLIDPAEVIRIDEWVKEAVAGGARLLCGGQPLSDTCYACTVLLNPPESVRVSTQEIFGPVVCIYTYRDVATAIARANKVAYSFQAAVFTKNIDLALKLFTALNGSAVMVNEHTAFRVDWMPFAGLQHSGYGTGGIPHTIRDMQIEKMLVVHSDELPD